MNHETWNMKQRVSSFKFQVSRNFMKQKPFKIRLIVGLGNPGEAYEKTRHNTGFIIAEEIRRAYDLPKWETKPKFFAEISEGKIGAAKAILARPQTMMNNSGKAVYAIAKFLKIKPGEILVVHDDADLPLSAAKLSKNKSAGGHRGVGSVIRALKTENFCRLRIGIQPSAKKHQDAMKLILGKFKPAEEKVLKKIIKKAVPAIETAINESLDKAMSEFN
jgi:PTH1 family peptidyl-tRNA hydrolase